MQDFHGGDTRCLHTFRGRQDTMEALVDGGLSPEIKRGGMYHYGRRASPGGVAMGCGMLYADDAQVIVTVCGAIDTNVSEAETDMINYIHGFEDEEDVGCRRHIHCRG